MHTSLYRFLSLCFLSISMVSCLSENKLDTLINKREYDKAYAYARKHPNTYAYLDYNPIEKIATAQVSDLILQGEYVVAKQIADENNAKFDNILQSKLQTIYETKGVNALLSAIARLRKPDFERPGYQIEEKIDDYNKEIELLAGLMKVNGETDYIGQLLKELIPSPYYKRVKNPKSGGFLQSETVIAKDKDGKDIVLYDYSEVNRIRQSFGFSPIKK